MIQTSRLSSSSCAFKYSACGTSPPPALNWIVSKGYSRSCVTSANRLASVDLPPPAFPKTATFLIRQSTRARPRSAFLRSSLVAPWPRMPPGVPAPPPVRRGGWGREARDRLVAGCLLLPRWVPGSRRKPRSCSPPSPAPPCSRDTPPYPPPPPPDPPPPPPSTA